VPTVDCSAAPTTLLPGQDLTCTASYTVSAADLRLSVIENTAEATGLDGAAVVSSASSTAAVTVAAPTVIAVILAQTGIAGLTTVSATALGLIALGLVLLVLRRRRA
jgi:hypothetical protein